MTRHNAFIQLVLSHLRGYLREPEAIFWTYGFPLVMVVGLGLAFNSETEAVIGFTVSEEASAHPAVRTLGERSEFDVRILPAEQALGDLRRNRTPLVVSLDAGGGVEYFFDPTNPEGSAARLAVDDALQRAAGRRDALEWTDQRTDTPGSRYVDFLVPGLIGMNIMGAGLWGIGFSTVDLRVKHLLKRMVATPMKRSHFLLSLVSSRIVFFIPEMLFLLAAAHLLFGVPIAGSYASILSIAFLGSLTFAGLGLLTASRARRIESISGLMNLVMIPMWLGSGIFFSSERFPAFLQPFIQALPLTQLINALRAVILTGESLASQSTPLAILGAWSIVSYALALKFFRWV
jgi:ABC-type multidrug transport system permease subunit